jgi:hypothetical protein
LHISSLAELENPPGRTGSDDRTRWPTESAKGFGPAFPDDDDNEGEKMEQHPLHPNEQAVFGSDATRHPITQMGSVPCNRRLGHQATSLIYP